MKLKTICFDIDNVICKTNATKDYSKSIKICNKLVNIDQFRYSVIDLLAINIGKAKDKAKK